MKSSAKKKSKKIQDKKKVFFLLNFDTSMGIWTDFLLHVGKKGKEIETLELFSGCKQAFRTQQRKHRDHSKFYLRRKSYYMSKE